MQKELKEMAEEIKSDFSQKINDGLEPLKKAQETAQKANEEAVDGVKSAVETVQSSVGELKTSVESVQSDVTDVKSKVDDAEQRMDELEKVMTRGEIGGEEFKTSGQEFVSSDEYKAALEKGGSAFDLSMDVKSFNARAISSDSGSFGDTARSERIDGVYQDKLRTLRVQDFIPQKTTERGSIEYIQESQPLILSSTAYADAASGQKVLQVSNIGGWKVGATVTIGANASVIDTIAYGVSGNEEAGTLTMVANLVAGVTAGDELTSDEFTWTPEGEYKAQLEAKAEEVEEKLETLAAYVRINRQIFEDSPMLRNYIDNRLPMALNLQLEKDLLYGTGVKSINGFFSRTEIPTYSKTTDGVAGDTRIDSLRRAYTVAELSHHAPDVGFVNPKDWENVELEKDTTNQYIQIMKYDSNGIPRLWRMLIVSTAAVKQGDFLIGNFQEGCEYWTRETINVRATDSHSDDFIRNKKVVLAETRGALAVYLPKSFVRGDFA